MQTEVSALKQTFSIKRIYRDVQELQDEVIPWVSICIPDPQNPFLLHGNVMIQDGPYKDVLIHLIIRLPKDYPLSQPAANIAPGHPFTRRFHEHIIPGQIYGASICTDLLSNFDWYFRKFEFSGKPIVSGWSPAYTLSSILMQLQIFFADPDLPESRFPSQEEIEVMKRQVKNFKYKITIKDGDRERFIVHTYAKPYPPFLHDYSQNRFVKYNHLSDEEKIMKQAQVKTQQFAKQEQNDYNVKNIPNENSLVNEKNLSIKELKFEIRNKLICPITKNTILSDPMPLFGYPVFIKTDEANRLWPTPVIEIISEEGMNYYVEQPAQIAYRKRTGNYTSVFGQEYNYWLPLYINQKHFTLVKAKIFKTITELYKKISPGETQKNFHPEMILKVLPPILVKTVIHMLKDDLHQSLAALDAYCQFYWLFMKLISLYPEVQQQIDEEAERFLHEEGFRHKRRVGDLGEFMFKLSLSKYSIHNTEMNEALLGEFLARQVSWAKERDHDLKKRGVSDLVKKFMKATTVACQFFLVQFETAKLMVNDSVRSELEEGYGLVNPTMLDLFMEKMNWIRKNMDDDWKVLIKNIGLESSISSEDEMQRILEAAFDQGEETYTRWGGVKCMITNVDFKDPSLPSFGYMLHTNPDLAVVPNLICKEAILNQCGTQWVPLYINAEHFKRVKSLYDSHLLSICKTLPLVERERYNLDSAKIAVKVFCQILISCVDRLSVLRKFQMNMLRAYLQVIWTFWKLLEQNVKMRELLDQEVELFKTQKSYTQDMSWPEWRECIIKLILSEKGRNNLGLWHGILEDLIKREAKNAIGKISRSDTQGFDCQKLGKFNQEHIKLLLLQIMLAKIVLQDKYRAALESKNGILIESELGGLREQIIAVLKERYYNLWKPTLEILEVKDFFKDENDISNLTKMMYRAAIKDKKGVFNEDNQKKESGNVLSQKTVESLGLKFVVKLDKKASKKKKMVTELSSLEMV